MVPKAACRQADRAHRLYRARCRRRSRQGQPIGVLKVWRNDNVILEMPLKAAESVGKGNLSQRAFDAVTEMMIALFRAGAERL